MDFYSCVSGVIMYYLELSNSSMILYISSIVKLASFFVAGPGLYCLHLMYVDSPYWKSLSKRKDEVAARS